MFALDLCRARLTYSLRLVSPLHVGGSGDDDEALVRHKRPGKDRNVQEYGLTRPGATEIERKQDVEVTLPIHQIDKSDQVVFMVPASSVRGALRAHLRWRFERTLEGAGRRTQERFRDDAATPSEYEGEPPTLEGEASAGPLLVRMTFGSAARRGQLALSAAVLRAEPTSAGVRYSDMDGVAEAGPRAARLRQGKLRLLVQNRLDRVTQASAGDGLRTLAALEVGQELEGSLWLRNFACWQLGLLALAEGAAARGELRLGGKTTVGLGRLELRFTGLHLGWHRRIRPTAGQPCFGIGEALRRMGMSDAGSDRGRGALGLREIATSQGLREAQLFLLDEKDCIDVASDDQRLKAVRDDSLLGQCYHHVSSTEPALIKAVLQSGAGRLKQVLLRSSEEVR